MLDKTDPQVGSLAQVKRRIILDLPSARPQRSAKIMISLDDPRLRVRDARKLFDMRSHEIIWDRGTSRDSEWVVASVTDNLSTNKLKEWLMSKGISANQEAIFIDSAWSGIVRTSWRQIIERPNIYRKEGSNFVIANDFSWILEFACMEVARFGRWKSGNQTAEQDVAPQSTTRSVSKSE